jgi:hypothetical protein
MITCNLKGGLGNQLFQIFTVVAYSFRVKNPFIFMYIDKLAGETPRPAYWDTLLSRLHKYTNYDKLITNEVLATFPKYNGDHGYTEIPILENRNVCLDGFFQSYKYFQNEFTRIYELLDIETIKSQVIFNNNTCTFPNNTDMLTISLHFRVGDYINKQCYHPVLPLIYYERSIQHIMNECPPIKTYHVYVFFEQKDIEYVKGAVSKLSSRFPMITFDLVTEETDWKQMILMSKCDHHIIANSTFSWWGATFARNHIVGSSGEFLTKKVVCYPSLWYGHQLYYINTTDLFNPDWTKITFFKSEMDMSYCRCFGK